MRFILSFLISCLLLLAKQTIAGGPTKFDKMDAYTLLDVAAKLSWKNLDSALIINDLALQKSFLARDFKAVFYIYRERGLYFEEHNRPSNAIPEYEKAAYFADSTGSDCIKLLPIVFTDLAIANRKAGNYGACKNWHEKALDIARRTQNLELEEDSLHGLGFLNETVGEWERAIDFYQKSILVAEKRKNKDGIIVSTQNIAKTLLRSGNRELALKTIEDAWQLSLALPDSLRQAHVLNDYGEILTEIGSFDAAFAKFQTSLLAYKSLGDRPMIARTLLNLGENFSKKGDSERAFEFFEHCAAFKNEIRPEDQVKLDANCGALYQKNNRLSEAKSAWASCMALAEQLNFKDYLQKSHLALSQIADAQNRPDEAFYHLKSATAIGDSLIGQEKDLRLAEMQFKFDAARSEQKLNDLKSHQTKILGGGIILALFLGFLFLFFRNREKAKSNKILSQKSAEIERKNLKLEESNHILQQFAWASAHDLKEPLRTIGSFVGLIQRRHGHSLPAEAMEYMQFVKDGVRRMDSLLSDLLEYSTLCAEEATTTEVTPLHRALRDVVSNLRETIRERGAIVELPLETPGLAIQRSHLVQLFQNLVSNAIKFSPDNPHVQIAFQRDLDGSLLFSIKDHGIGIDQAYENKVFQVFHRLHRNKFEGTGIGLALCRNIMDKYGGHIWFESQPDQGTTFFMRFPWDIEIVAASGERVLQPELG